MIRRPPRSTQSRSSAASDVYKRQVLTGGGSHADVLGVQGHVGHFFLELLQRGVVDPTNAPNHHVDVHADQAKMPEFLVFVVGDVVRLSLIHISEPTRLGMISYAV